MRTAACLVVGNEVLSGKIDEKNVAVLAKALFRLGISLRRVVICPDEIPVIARDVNALRKTYDFVFTSGGIGPTHDDVTIDGVAEAFGVRLLRDPRIVKALEAYYGPKCTEHHLRMANLPEGGAYVGSPDPVFTTLRIANVFVLPGVPAYFEKKLEGLIGELDAGEVFHNRTLFLEGDEGDYAALLERVHVGFPSVTAGSYLAPPDADYDCRVTFDGPELAEVEAAAATFEAGITVGRVIRRAESGAP